MKKTTLEKRLAALPVVEPDTFSKIHADAAKIQFPDLPDNFAAAITMLRDLGNTVPTNPAHKIAIEKQKQTLGEHCRRLQNMPALTGDTREVVRRHERLVASAQNELAEIKAKAKKRK